LRSSRAIVDVVSYFDFASELVGQLLEMGETCRRTKRRKINENGDGSFRDLVIPIESFK